VGNQNVIWDDNAIMLQTERDTAADLLVMVGMLQQQSENRTVILEAGQSEDCKVANREVSKVSTHAPIITEDLGHASNLSLSNGFWSRPGESKFELLILFSKWKLRWGRYRVS
jgi:hypothetical protein